MSKSTNTLPKTLLGFVFFCIKRQRGNFSLMFFLSIFWPINESIYPYFIKIFIDKITHLPRGPMFFKPLLIPFVIFVLSWSLSILASRIYEIVAIYTWPKFRTHIRKCLLTHTYGHAYSYFSVHLTGGLANKIVELPRSCEYILSVVMEHFFSILLVFCISLIILFKTSMLFGFILLIFIILFVTVTVISIPKINQTANLHAETLIALNGQIVDSLSGMQVVRLFASPSYELAYLHKYQINEMASAKQAAWMIQRANVWKGLLFVAWMVVTFFTLIYSWNYNWISTGDFAFIATTFFNLMGILWYASIHATQITREIGVAKASFSLINEPHTIKDKENAKPLSLSKGSIFLDKVTFYYDPALKLFDQLSLKIKGGQKVGLVGFSGAGKTTLTRLILRWHDLLSGTIYIDGQDISCVTQVSLYQQISLIPQDPLLFHRTVWENITYGCAHVTEAKVKEVLKMAHCGEFIQNLTHGLQTVVGERGAKLSGGQRQRIVIARALLKNAPILIMDEATSALDSVTEQLIQDGLQVLMQERTTLVIAHRLSTLNHMDRIVVFDKGEIIEDGTLSELLSNKKGYFKLLWEMQVNGFLPNSVKEP